MSRRALDPSKNFAFELTGSHGAALATKYQTHRMDALVDCAFEKYTKRHYQSWVRFACDKGIGNDVHPVLVSGFDLTRDFAMVAYSDDNSSLGADLTIAVPTPASASTPPWGTWHTRCSPHTNEGPLEHNLLPPERAAEPPPQSVEAGNIPREFNQCVFLRYYTMRPRGSFAIFSEVIWAGTGPHDFRPGDNRGGAFPELAVQSEAEPLANDDEGPGGQWDLVEEDDDGFELEITGHNTPHVQSFSCPFSGILTLFKDEERDSWDIVADYVFQVIHFFAVSPDHSAFSVEEFQCRIGANAPP